MSTTSLSDYLETQQCSAELNAVIFSLTEACHSIHHSLEKGALAGILGAAGAENVQGEDQKKLDVIANDLIKQALAKNPAVRGLASEEEANIVPCETAGQYLVTFDPLDGSSNIDINSMVGTIFSILENQGDNPANEQDFLQPGRQQIAAGYVLYGPSTMLALSVGKGVAMFTLDPGTGEYLLTNNSVNIDAQTKEFAVNMSNQRFWSAPMQRYISELLQGADGPRNKNYNMRWVAAMVADVHRILCRGGLFTYPWDSRKPDQAGKLRLMYEANPMGYLVEQAGGEIWTQSECILDIQPQHIHQRVPVILGAKEEVLRCVEYHRNV